VVMFKLHKGADKWCSKLKIGSGSKDSSDAIKTKLDFFYLCFLLGVSKGQQLYPSVGQTVDIIDHWTKEFVDYRDLMIGVLLFGSLDSQKIKITKDNKALIQSELNKLIDGNSVVRMSSDGMGLINAYAYAGFEIMQDEDAGVGYAEDQITFLGWFCEQVLPKYFDGFGVSGN